jgi:hypothetical protein
VFPRAKVRLPPITVIVPPVQEPNRPPVPPLTVRSDWSMTTLPTIRPVLSMEPIDPVLKIASTAVGSIRPALSMCPIKPVLYNPIFAPLMTPLAALSSSLMLPVLDTPS